MEKRKRFLASGPWIISGISLFVALSSSAIALKGTNSVNSGDIKNGSVQSKDLKNGGVAGVDLAPGSISAGTIGHHTIIRDNISDGAIWGSTLSTRRVENRFNIQSLSTTTQRYDATCPNGSTLITGGATTSGDGIPVIQASFPDASGNNPDTWHVDARVLNNVGSNFINAFAVCLDG